MIQKFLKGFLSFILIIPVQVTAQEASGTFSLADAIAIAIKNNPSQQSNRLMVESAHDEAKAQRLNNFRPYLRFNVGATRGGLGPSTTPQGFYQTSGLSAGQVVYDGGARRSRVNALDHSVEAMEAQFNSTNALIPDTSGALAREIFEYYYGIARTYVTIDFNKSVLELLSKVKPYIKDPTAISKLSNTERNYKTGLDSSLNKIGNYKTEMEHLLYATLPDDLESLDQTNERMKKDLAPYSDVEHAIAVAKEKNQNYLAKLYLLKAAEENAKARKAELTRPTVEVVVSDSYSQSKYYDDIDSSNSRNGYVGVQVSYAIRAGIKNSLSASTKKVTAAQQQTEKEIDDFVFNIKANYDSLKTSDQNLESFKANIIRLQNQIDEFIKVNAAPGKVINLDSYNFFQELIGDLNNNVKDYYSAMYDALSQRYALQREIGILFDAVKENAKLEYR